MKNAIIILLAVLGLTACEKEKLIDTTDLPSAAQAYIETHFGETEIVQVVKDIDGLRKTYDVYLSTGVELEFDKSGVIKSVESNRNDRLPDSVIPTTILAYATANYPDAHIVSWETDDRGQEIELSNGLDLHFNANGD